MGGVPLCVVFSFSRPCFGGDLLHCVLLIDEPYGSQSAGQSCVTFFFPLRRKMFSLFFPLRRKTDGCSRLVLFSHYGEDGRKSYRIGAPPYAPPGISEERDDLLYQNLDEQQTHSSLQNRLSDTVEQLHGLTEICREQDKALTYLTKTKIPQLEAFLRSQNPAKAGVEEFLGKLGVQDKSAPVLSRPEEDSSSEGRKRGAGGTSGEGSGSPDGGGSGSPCGGSRGSPKNSPKNSDSCRGGLLPENDVGDAKST